MKVSCCTEKKYTETDALKPIKFISRLHIVDKKVFGMRCEMRLLCVPFPVRVPAFEVQILAGANEPHKTGENVLLFAPPDRF